MAYLWVALGSALGGILRYWLSGAVAVRFGETFPWGTLLVNIIGSFVIGILANFSAADSRWFLSPASRQFLMIGVCGGFTTFSSFSLQTLNLLHDGQWSRAGANIGLSVLLCMVAVWLGFVTAAWFNQLRG